MDQYELPCGHPVVKVKTTSGDFKKVSTCLLEEQDVDGDGYINWPPSGNCTGGGVYE